MTNDEKLAEFRKRLEETWQLDPVVVIRLRKDEYKLEFDNKAIKGVYTDTGVNLMSTTVDLNDPAQLGSILYRGLLRNHPTITQDEVDALISARHIPYIHERINLALQAFMPRVADLVDTPAGEGEALDPTKQPTPVG